MSNKNKAKRSSWKLLFVGLLNVAFQSWTFRRWLQLRFDFDSTGVRLLIEGH